MDVARGIRAHPRPDAGVQILPFGWTIHNRLMEIRENVRKGGNFTHPVSGRVVIINRTGQGFSTRYEVSVDTQAAELENYDWIDEQHDLAELISLPTAEDEQMADSAIEVLTGHSDTAAALPRQGRRPAARARISSDKAGPARSTTPADPEPKSKPYRSRQRAQDSLNDDY